MNDYSNPQDDGSSDNSDSTDDAQRLYEMGQQLCEMAKSMGYQEEDDSSDTSGDDAMPAAKPKGKTDKMGLAMSFLNK